MAQVSKYISLFFEWYSDHCMRKNCGLALLFFCLSSMDAYSAVVSDIQSKSTAVISFERYSESVSAIIDESDALKRTNRFVLDFGDRYFAIRLDIDTIPQNTLYYRIDGYDHTWFHFDNGPIRSGGIPEGNYNFVVARKLEEGKMITIYSAGMQVRAGFFHGIRGYVAAFIVGIVMLYLFFRGRKLILRKDRNRTVKMLENTVQKRTVQLQQLLAQRELLLKEIHHRVKNNLQVISALLEMQSSRTTDEKVRIAITESQNRVLSIAFIHQNLYQHDDLKGVEIGSFLKELTSHIKQVFETSDCPVEVITLVPEIFLDIDSAIPLGLIINELLTNSYKYAFKGRNDGNIRIELKLLSDGDFYFNYFDDGVGLPMDYDLMKSNSLGLKLIRQLSRQLAGNIKYQFLDGSCFELTFKNLEARSQMT